MPMIADEDATTTMDKSSGSQISPGNKWSWIKPAA